MKSAKTCCCTLAVTWPSQPANVDFVIDAQSRAEGYRIYSEAGGLRLKRFMGVMILVR